MEFGSPNSLQHHHGIHKSQDALELAGADIDPVRDIDNSLIADPIIRGIPGAKAVFFVENAVSI